VVCKPVAFIVAVAQPLVSQEVALVALIIILFVMVVKDEVKDGVLVLVIVCRNDNSSSSRCDCTLVEDKPVTAWAMTMALSHLASS
jgi:hypothetical protein